MAVTRRQLMAVVGSVFLCFVCSAPTSSSQLRCQCGTRPSPLMPLYSFSRPIQSFGLCPTSHIKDPASAVDSPRARAPEAYHRLDATSRSDERRDADVATGGAASPNAFAIGGGTGTIVVDRRLFRLLSAAEFEGLLAHELAI